MKFDKRIRACIILDQKGNPLHRLVKDKVTRLLSESETMKLFLHTAFEVGMDKFWDKQLGTTRHVVIIRDKVTLAIFPLVDGKSIIVSAHVTFPVNRFTKLGEFIDSAGLSL